MTGNTFSEDRAPGTSECGAGAVRAIHGAHTSGRARHVAAVAALAMLLALPAAALYVAEDLRHTSGDFCLLSDVGGGGVWIADRHEPGLKCGLLFGEILLFWGYLTLLFLPIAVAAVFTLSTVRRRLTELCPSSRRARDARVIRTIIYAGTLAYLVGWPAYFVVMTYL